MRTVDTVSVQGPIDKAFAASSEVERWPQFLPHYRWVKMVERRSDGGLVEMAAWRPFGVFKYPTWWVSEMTILPDDHRVLYKHVDGITRGMDVEWRLVETNDAVEISIVHDWAGPQWPFIGAMAADLVIGPIFIRGIASRTLAGVKQETERA
jgi:ribosome-associated toxin RatA of RatAB toxin-antitoxin module